MIRLIASDLDGTLLRNYDSKISGRLIRQIKTLKEMGIEFLPASGRQYPNLQRLFEPVKDEISYVAENGSLVIHGGEIVHKSVINRNIGQEILTSIRNRPNCEILLSGVNTAYIQPKEERYADHIRNVVKNNITVVDDILEVEEDYLKISVLDFNGINNSEEYFKEKFQDLVTVVTSGNIWLDMVPKGVNKATALQFLGERLGIEPSQMMAFGDHYNDLEMLSFVGESYAMFDAKPGIREICRHTADSVENVIDRFIRQYKEG